MVSQKTAASPTSMIGIPQMREVRMRSSFSSQVGPDGLPWRTAASAMVRASE